MEIPAFLGPLQNILGPSLAFVSFDPLIRGAQLVLGILASVLIFLVFWTTRDILSRTRSLLYQLLCILLVAVLPIVGFFLYLLIRPTRSLAQKDLEATLQEVIELVKSRGVAHQRRERVHTVKAQLKAKAVIRPSSDRHSSLDTGQALSRT